MGITMIREQARGLTRDQRNAFLASWLGWAMDAFDYFLLVFVIRRWPRTSARLRRTWRWRRR